MLAAFAAACNAGCSTCKVWFEVDEIRFGIWDAGEAEEDGYEDEYQLEDIDIGAGNYIKATPVGSWRHMWEDTSPDSEMADDYGLGVREGLQVPQISGLMSDTSICTPPCARPSSYV